MMTGWEMAAFILIEGTCMALMAWTGGPFWAVAGLFGLTVYECILRWPKTPPPQEYLPPLQVDDSPTVHYYAPPSSSLVKMNSEAEALNEERATRELERHLERLRLFEFIICGAKLGFARDTWKGRTLQKELLGVRGWERLRDTLQDPRFRPTLTKPTANGRGFILRYDVDTTLAKFNMSQREDSTMRYHDEWAEGAKRAFVPGGRVVTSIR